MLYMFVDKFPRYVLTITIFMTTGIPIRLHSVSNNPVYSTMNMIMAQT